jgi:hypothetical protein
VRDENTPYIHQHIGGFSYVRVNPLTRLNILAVNPKTAVYSLERAFGIAPKITDCARVQAAFTPP